MTVIAAPSTHHHAHGLRDDKFSGETRTRAGDTTISGTSKHRCVSSLGACGGRDTCRYAWFRRDLGHERAVRGQNA